MHNLLCMHFTHGAAHNGRILAVHIDEAAFNGAIAGHNAVSRCFLSLHVKVCASGSHICADFNKAVVIQQCVDSFHCRCLC